MASRVKAFAPGRVNLIGEHTDHQDGLCLPFAIERGITVTGEAAGASEVEVLALDLGEHDRFPIKAPTAPPHGTADTAGQLEVAPGAGPRSASTSGAWRQFVRGAVAELTREGIELRGCRLEIAGDLPRGAGLSSSAALSVALCLALGAIADAPDPDRLWLARLCSRIENDWCGAQTGLLDQLAVLFGQQGHALRIDVREPAVEPIALDLHGHVLAVLDSGAPRDVAASGYNARRADCDQAAALLGVSALRDVAEPTPRSAPLAPDRLPPALAARVRHVTNENRRVDQMVSALRAGDFVAAGSLLDASHASLRDDFEVSVPAIELAVIACERAGALGARLIGGGFGGSVLALYPPSATLPTGSMLVEPGPAAQLI